MKRHTLLFAFLLLISCIAAGVGAQWFIARYERWAVYYGAALPYDTFAAYDTLAFDSDAYPDFSDRKREGQIILGYLSTSEAEEYRTYYGDIAAMDVFLQPSEAWDAHTVIDIRKQEWQDYFVNTLVPRVLAKGFDGIMLDTIDTPLYLEAEHPEAFAGMREAAIRLIKAVRAAHPEAKLMLNRGFPILSDIAEDVDYVLAESILVNYNSGDPRYFPQEIYDEYTAALTNAKKENPDLKVMTLDYWDMAPTGRQEIRRIYARQRSHGFIPYVTTIDLSHHHEEPL